MYNVEARIFAPTSVTTTATSGTATSAISFGGAVKVWLKADVKTFISFGTSGMSAPTAAGLYLTADVDYVLDVPPAITHYRAILASSTGTITHASVQ